MNKILKLSIDEIILAGEKASEAVNAACSRHINMEVTGCCIKNNIVLITMEEREKPCRYTYVIAPFPTENEDGIIAEINSRYCAGFSTIGAFPVKDRTWGLFAFDPEAVKAPAHEKTEQEQ